MERRDTGRCVPYSSRAESRLPEDGILKKAAGTRNSTRIYKNAGIRVADFVRCIGVAPLSLAISWQVVVDNSELYNLLRSHKFAQILSAAAQLFKVSNISTNSNKVSRLISILHFINIEAIRCYFVPNSCL